MNKKTTGLVAGAAGAALLMGGATFALWSDSEVVDGGKLTAGNLDVGPVEQVWTDSKGNAVDWDDFRIVPGDTIYGEVTVPVSLEGDHMYADLSVSGFPQLSGKLQGGLEPSVSVKLDGNTFAITGQNPVRFASEDNVNDHELPEIGTESKFVVTAEVTFAENVGERGRGTQELTQEVAELKNFTVNLKQVRN